MQTSVEDEAAIRQLIEDAQAAQSDTDVLMALHTPDTIIVNFGGRRVLGRDAFEEAMRAALSSPLADVTTRVEAHDIRSLRHDVALVSCTKHVSDGRDTNEKFASSGSLTYVVVQDEGIWRIALAQTTPIAS